MTTYRVHDRKVSPLQTFSAINTRYAVIDQDNKLYDEFTSKKAAIDTVSYLNIATK